MGRSFLLLLLLLALFQPAPPAYFQAQWDSPGAATVSWHQEARGCLYVEHATQERVFIGCYERWPATIVIELGGPGTDGHYRPTSGDVYTLQTSGQIYRAPLVARPIYLAVWRA